MVQATELSSMPEIACAPLKAALTNPGAGPKWRRLADAMRASVLRGEFRPQDRVPPEAALSRALTISVGTVQKALNALADEGVLVRSRRTGTFIADRKGQVDRVYVYRFRDPATGDLLMPFVRTLAIRDGAPAGPWRDALGDALVQIDRLVWVADRPPAFNSLFLRREHGARLLDTPLEKLHGSSCHKLLAEQFNLPTARMAHSISCARLSPRATERLGVAPGALGLVWDVRDDALGGEPVLFQRFEMTEGHPPMEIFEAVNRSGRCDADAATRQ
jgi:DNA-binding GntR family transcriptional regulator